MELGTVLSVVQTLRAALESCVLKEALSVEGYRHRSQLECLQRTVCSVEAVLHDAEAKQEIPHEAQMWIDEIKAAVFEADDLFDEFLTLAQQKQLLKDDCSLSQKVRNFFSRSKNPLSLASRMSHGIKYITTKLNAIVDDRHQYDLSIDYKPIRRRRAETCSYIREDSIIGREHDLNNILDKLLASSESDVSFLSVVGIGGLGKTALAQLVYNDPRVTNSFPLKMWTCVSDQDGEVFDMKSILMKILESITHHKYDRDLLTMDEVQSQLQEELAGKKYFLVLDDVWTENRDKWIVLEKYLKGGERGSRIMVTTRSKVTASIISNDLTYELKGLSEQNSWRLFEKSAFEFEQLNQPDDELVKIGKKIVRGCAGVPLAIRVAGSLLYGQEKSKWFAVQKFGLANFKEAKYDIVSILQLSFHHLPSSLKSCFSYCAMFPKDFVIDKDTLIALWMAHGYIVPFGPYERISIENIAEEYFLILLKRCFFQDIMVDDYGEIVSCKIHDLMHDLAQNALGKELYALDSIRGNVEKNVRHLSIYKTSEYNKFNSLGMTHIRSLLFFNQEECFQLAVDELVGRHRFLRVLDLSGTNIKLLPDSVGELLHLRYIDLSRNSDLEVLPGSINKLRNLQTFKLGGCYKLKELPKEMSELVKLMILDTEDCDELSWMPLGMGNLVRLHTLKGGYRVGGGGRCTSWKQWFDGLDALKTLNNLKGQLKINLSWPKHAENDDVEEDRRENLYLRSMEHLNHIELRFIVEEDIKKIEDLGITMTLMEGLQPHPNLKRLTVRGYHGLKMPGWAAVLPNLVSLCLYECKELKYLPCLGNLCNLKFLRLFSLPNLLYIEEDSVLLASTTEEAVSFFPSLESLDFFCLPQFKGWRRAVSMEETSTSIDQPRIQHYFSHLKTLTISQCPELKCILLCPLLETLSLMRFNERLQVLCTNKDDKFSEAAIQNPGSLDSILVPKLKEVIVDKAAWLDSIPVESFHNIRSLRIHKDRDMLQLPSCIQSFPALRALEVFLCEYLKTMPNWMPKLTHLRHLTLSACSESLKKRCQKYPPGEDWKYIKHIPNIAFR